MGPFSLGDPDRVRAVLTAAGFGVPVLVGVREPMFFGSAVATAGSMVLGVVGGLLADLDAPARAAAVDRIRADLHVHLGPGGVTHRSTMWMITAGRAG